MASPLPSKPIFELGKRYPFPSPHDGITLRFERAGAMPDDVLEMVIDLLRRAFNGGPSWFAFPVPPRDHLRWKATEHGGRSLFQLVEDGERLVGFYLDVRERFLLDGSEALQSTGFDYAFDPEYQGRRLGTAWTELIKPLDMHADADLSIGYAMHPTSRVRRGVPSDTGTELFGNQLVSLMRPLGLRRMLEARRERSRVGAAGSARTRAVLEQQARRGPSWLKPEYAAIGRSFLRRIVPPGPRATRSAVRVTTVTSFDERIDEFWSKASAAFDLIRVRDREYLDWRYRDARGGPRTVRLAEIDGQVVGYSVLRRADAAAVLDDLLALPGREDVTRALVADALRWAEAAGAAYVRAWIPKHHPYRAALAEFAFTPYPSPVLFNFTPRRIPAEELAFLRDPRARVHFMIADSDHW